MISSGCLLNMLILHHKDYIYITSNTWDTLHAVLSWQHSEISNNITKHKSNANPVIVIKCLKVYAKGYSINIDEWHNK